jgi:hypothetical protein
MAVSCFAPEALRKGDGAAGAHQLLFTEHFSNL